MREGAENGTNDFWKRKNAQIDRLRALAANRVASPVATPLPSPVLLGASGTASAGLHLDAPLFVMATDVTALALRGVFLYFKLLHCILISRSDPCCCTSSSKRSCCCWLCCCCHHHCACSACYHSCLRPCLCTSSKSRPSVCRKCQSDARKFPPQGAACGREPPVQA